MNTSNTIQIVSPSAPTAGRCPNRFQRAIYELTNIGFIPHYSKNVLEITNFTSGNGENRANDLLNALNTAKFVMATIGGFNSNDILPYINLWKLNNHSIFIGYSDMTILLQALKSNFPYNIQTIHGPMLLPQFGEFGGIHPFTLKSFQQVIFGLGTGEWYSLPSSEEYTEEFLLWDHLDNRKRIYKPNLGWKVIQENCAEGVLIPCNLNTFVTLSGTGYEYVPSDSIFFLEDVDSETPASIKRNLMHIKLIYNKKIKGLVFGRFLSQSKITYDILYFIVKDMFPNIPIIANVDFGHTDPILSLPVGNFIQIDTSQPSIKVKL